MKHINLVRKPTDVQLNEKKGQKNETNGNLQIVISSGLFSKAEGPRCFETPVKSPTKVHKSHQQDNLNFHSCESFESQMEHTF